MIRINLNIIGILFIFFSILSSCNHLQTGEIVTINHIYSGCFGAGTNTLTMYQRDGLTYARLVKDGQKIRNIKLSATQVKAFDSFINNLTQLKETSGCTTVETYVAYTKNGIIRKEDGGCGWHGFEDLTREVFGKMEE